MVDVIVSNAGISAAGNFLKVDAASRDAVFEPYVPYCLELAAAMEGKFAHLPDDGMNYAYQLDSTLYAKFLRAMAEADGTTFIEGRIARVALDGESGDVAALHLDSGMVVEGDLFLDCTGFRALLIEQALHAGFDDWTHWLPCDSVIVVQTENVRPPVPYTRAMAHDAGGNGASRSSTAPGTASSGAAAIWTATPHSNDCSATWRARC